MNIQRTPWPQTKLSSLNEPPPPQGHQVCKQLALHGAGAMALLTQMCCKDGLRLHAKFVRLPQHGPHLIILIMMRAKVKTPETSRNWQTGQLLQKKSSAGKI